MSQALSISLALQPALFHSIPSSSTSSTCIPGAHTPSSSILHLSRKSSSLSLSSASFPRSSSEPSLFLPRFRSRAGTTGATFIAPPATPSSSTTDVLHVRSETSATRACHRSPLSSCSSAEHHNNNTPSTAATNSIIIDSRATESSVLDSIELSAPASGILSSTSSSSSTRCSSQRRHSHSEVFIHSSHSEPTPSPQQPSTHAAGTMSGLISIPIAMHVPNTAHPQFVYRHNPHCFCRSLLIKHTRKSFDSNQVVLSSSLLSSHYELPTDPSSVLWKGNTSVCVVNGCQLIGLYGVKTLVSKQSLCTLFCSIHTGQADYC